MQRATIAHGFIAEAAELFDGKFAAAKAANDGAPAFGA
jgi:hypothetical protein